MKAAPEENENPLLSWVTKLISFFDHLIYIYMNTRVFFITFIFCYCYLFPFLVFLLLYFIVTFTGYIQCNNFFFHYHAL